MKPLLLKMSAFGPYAGKTVLEMDRLGEKYAYEIWGPGGDGRTIVRFCTSWATRDEDVEALKKDIKALKM